jgi:glucokinase
LVKHEIMHSFFIPIAFPDKEDPQENLTILAADSGGTKTHMALFEIKNGQFSIVRENIYKSQDWASFTDMVLDFGVTSPKPDRLSFAVAGPVQEGKVQMTNLNWVIDTQELREKTGVKEVFLLNDLKAIAYGLAALQPADLIEVYMPENRQHGNAAIIAPGTGLGEAGLFWDGEELHPFDTEGGHTDFASRSELDDELFYVLQKKYGHVSWERVVSGMGIVTIYDFLRDVKKMEEPGWLKDKISEGDKGGAIGQAAKEGCPICVETIRLFMHYLAVEASNLALKMKCTGGLFIGGGIPPKVWSEPLQAYFLEHFFQVGRLRPLLEAMPIYLILNQQSALLGAAYFGAFGVAKKTEAEIL